MSLDMSYRMAPYSDSSVSQHRTAKNWATVLDSCLSKVLNLKLSAIELGAEYI